MECDNFLIEPHGGKLVNRYEPSKADPALKKIFVSEKIISDCEQIAMGTFSPLTGFMKEKDFWSVIENMRLENGVIWTIPIILPVSKKIAEKLNTGEKISLVHKKDLVTYATLELEEKYTFDKEKAAKLWFGYTDEKHPGVYNLINGGDILLGGRITLIKNRHEGVEYVHTPRYVREQLGKKGWRNVVGFSSRNVPHRSHEYIHHKAVERVKADGLFIQPLVGEKKPGDFKGNAIVKAYDYVLDNYYDSNKVFFSTTAVAARHSGPKEAILVAIVKKNFGCNYIVIGRDHAGLYGFYGSKESQTIFNKFPDLGVKSVCFENIVYDKLTNKYVKESETNEGREISGTLVRDILKSGETPPDWCLRKDVGELLLKMIKDGKEVFMK
jgi:sulfate adenylyltransferase